eukprot:m.319970 g.319970  ORF g.319970 m.319970 type:complete len:69 (+) comp20311_c0_seq2:1297-1503(+)
MTQCEERVHLALCVANIVVLDNSQVMTCEFVCTLKACYRPTHVKSAMVIAKTKQQRMKLLGGICVFGN